MNEKEKIIDLEARIKCLEKAQYVERDYAQKALGFVKFAIYLFLGVLAVAGFVLFMWWGQTAKEIKEAAKARLTQIQSEEIFLTYKKEADAIIKSLKDEVEMQKLSNDLYGRRNFYQNFGEDEKAIAVGKEIIEAFPDNPWSYYNQAYLYVVYEQNPDSPKMVRKYLEKAFEIDAEQMRPYLQDDSFFYDLREEQWFKDLLK